MTREDRDELVAHLAAQNPDVAMAACVEYMRTRGQNVHREAHAHGRLMVRAGAGEDMLMNDPRVGANRQQSRSPEWTEAHMAEVDAELEALREARNIG